MNLVKGNQNTKALKSFQQDMWIFKKNMFKHANCTMCFTDMQF